MNLNRKITECRACKGSLSPLFSLGNLCISDFPEKSKNGQRSPLNLIQCDNCRLVQLEHTVDRDQLFKHFWYQSSTSKTMPQALSDITWNAMRIAKPDNHDLALDIGCNDGALLRSYPTFLERVGFEPAFNMADYARKNGSGKIINDYFSHESYWKHFGKRKAKIITTAAMFYDLDNPARFVHDIAKTLAADGLWIDQQNYLPTMLSNNNYDNILHEHLCYYSLNTFSRLLDQDGLELIRGETNPVNGGSFRSYIAHKGFYPKESLLDEATIESEQMKHFHGRIHEQASLLHTLIVNLVEKGKTVYTYGCGTRGNTILQYSGLSNKLIKKGCDANPEKWGRYTVGTNIPIISKEQARKEKPDYFLVLPHHFRNEIVEAEHDYVANGGKLIFPLPRVDVM